MVLGLLLVWLFVTWWYLVIFVLFGVIAFPYRLIRRHQRKELHTQRAQLAAMQTFMAGQMKQPPEPPEPPVD